MPEMLPECLNEICSKLLFIAAPAAQRFGVFCRASLMDHGSNFLHGGEHGVRQPHPFKRHFAVNGANFDLLLSSPCPNNALRNARIVCVYRFPKWP